MKDKPILFSAPMICAVLRGDKTQTRRLVNYQTGNGVVPYHTSTGSWNFVIEATGHGTRDPFPCPYGGVGDYMWAREAWRVGKGYDELPGSKFAVPSRNCIKYEADQMPDGSIAWGRYRHARFMPRWASRLTLKITDVRIQRLQDISKEDAKAEGLSCLSKDIGSTYKYGIPDKDGLPGNDDHGWHWHEWEVDPRHAYERLWGKINGRFSWEENYWVWAVSFNVIHKNIDEVLNAK